MGETRRCAVLGRPVQHSLSPAMHRAAYREVGLDWTYEAIEVGEDDLARFLDAMDHSWRGLSLTMPLKRTALALMDELTGPAQLAGGVNTVIVEEGRRVGHNTDLAGAVAAIRERDGGPVTEAVILGGGATAGSVLLALADLGCEHVTIMVRDPSRAVETLAAAERHPAAPIVDVRSLGTPAASTDVLVSTIPAAAQDAAVVTLADNARVVFDVVYDPWPTPLVSFARREGRVLVSGIDLLVQQGALQFRLMTGAQQAPVESMRAAAEGALEARISHSG